MGWTGAAAKVLLCLSLSLTDRRPAEPQEVATLGFLPDARQSRGARLQQLRQLLHLLLQGFQVSLCWAWVRRSDSMHLVTVA